MKVRLVLTDLDGTVVPIGTDAPTARVVNAVRAAEDAGVRVSAVTGRYVALARQLLAALEFKDLCVFDGGAVIAHPKTEEVVWERLLHVDQLRDIARILAPHSTIFSLGEGKEQVLVGGAYDIMSITAPATHVWASVAPDIAEELAAEIRRNPEFVAHCNPESFGESARVGVHVTHRGADKFHGVQELLRLEGISPEHVVAIGDGDNDLPLFKSAGFKIAMGNASPALKAAADAVVGDVRSDGFAEAIEKFVLPKSA